jgi:hypothetical protein
VPITCIEKIYPTVIANLNTTNKKTFLKKKKILFSKKAKIRRNKTLFVINICLFEIKGIEPLFVKSKFTALPLNYISNILKKKF